MAHPVPAAIREQLAAQLAPYRARHRAVRWTASESWHLTLLFIGAVDPRRTGELEALVDRVRASDPPYVVSLDSGGGRSRPNEGGVAWLALSEGAGQLIAIADSLAAGCPPDISHRSRPKRTPSAHLTVVRRADQSVIEALRNQRQGPIGVSWTVDRLALVRSHLEDGGARYETVYEGTL